MNWKRFKTFSHIFSGNKSKIELSKKKGCRPPQDFFTETNIVSVFGESGFNLFRKMKTDLDPVANGCCKDYQKMFLTTAIFQYLNFVDITYQEKTKPA